MSPGIDDAVDEIISVLQRASEPITTRSQKSHQTYNCDLWIPYVADGYWRKATGVEVGGSPPPAPDEVYSVFFDAAWHLCRIGVLRSGTILANRVAPAGITGDGFSMTAAGQVWVKAYDRFSGFPLDPGRFAAVVSKF